ncbi:MAG: O-methyltransferase [Anaerovoracaceae bacterium]|jgi:predicted O-methyltransferase YrrM
MSNIINEDITEYLDQMYEPINQAMAEFRKKDEPKIPIIRRNAEALMAVLLTKLQPKKILEIGTATGYSASVMAYALPECLITTIESYEPRYRAALGNFEKLGIADRIEAKLGDGSDVLEEMYQSGCGIYDFIFIDAAKSHYREFWDKAVKMGAPGTVVLCDNVLLDGIVADEKYLETRRDRTSMSRMREFLDYINNKEDVKTCVLPVGDGISISVLKDRK